MTREGWRRLWRALREGDLVGVAALVSRRTGILRFDRVLILETAVRADRPLLRRLREREPDLTVRLAQVHDEPELRRLFPHNAGRYGDRFTRGDSCLLVEQGGKPVAMGWVRFDHSGGVAELECRLELPEDACWGHDTFILPEQRRRGAFAALMWEMFSHIREKGRTVMYASVNQLNDDSWVAHTRLRYSIAAIVDRFILAGFRIYRISRPRAAGPSPGRRWSRRAVFRLGREPIPS